MIVTIHLIVDIEDNPYIDDAIDAGKVAQRWMQTLKALEPRILSDHQIEMKEWSIEIG